MEYGNFGKFWKAYTKVSYPEQAKCWELWKRVRRGEMSDLEYWNACEPNRAVCVEAYAKLWAEIM